MKTFLKFDRVVKISVLAVGGVAVLYSFLAPPTYKATLQLSIDPGDAASSMVRTVDSWQAYIGKQKDAIKSNDLLEKVADKLHLRFSRKFASKDPVPILRRKIKTDHVSGTNLVNINVYMDDPELASKVVVTLAEQYMATKEEKKFALTKEATAWLKEGNQISKKISESKEALNKFVTENKLESLKDDIAKDREKLDYLKKEKEERAALIKELGMKLEEIEPAFKKEDKDKLFFLLKDNQNVIDMKNMKEQAELKIVKLKAMYEESHPEIVKLRKELSDINSRMGYIVDNMIKTDRAELEEAKKEKVVFSEDAEKLKKELDVMEEKEIGLDDLSRRVEMAQKLYDDFLNRLKEGSFSLVEVTNLGFVGQEEALTKPIGPRKIRNIIFGIFMGFVIGNVASMMLKDRKSSL